MLTLLIDGDILAYQTATIIEKPIRWNEETTDAWTIHWFAEDGYKRMDNQLEWLKKELNADRIVVCLSDKENFRYSIYPNYKGNRKATRRPAPLEDMKNYLQENYECFIRPTLEADDVLGILATSPKIIEGDKIIVSIDKDLMSIPTKVFSLNKARTMMNDGDITEWSEGVIDVTPQAAEMWHMTQTLAGDTTDGYSGCPSVGKEKAKAILENPTKLEAYDYEITRGSRKGTTETRYREGEPCSLWEAVVAQYLKAGLTEKDALTQARVARILHADDYDFKKKVPKLWTPKKKLK